LFDRGFNLGDFRCLLESGFQRFGFFCCTQLLQKGLLQISLDLACLPFNLGVFCLEFALYLEVGLAEFILSLQVWARFDLLLDLVDLLLALSYRRLGLICLGSCTG